jgi:hypothetical protein
MLAAIALGGALLALGCGDTSGIGNTVPVSGRITLDGQPLTSPTTVVLFKPEVSRRDTKTLEPIGTVDAHGNYTLFTGSKKGAPPGRYKVIVTATEVHGDGGVQGPPNHRPRPKSLVPAQYGQATTTPFAIEVVENPAPGVYDLVLISG